MDVSTNLESKLIIKTFLNVAIFCFLSNMLNGHYYVIADTDIIVKAEFSTSHGKTITLTNQPAPPTTPLPAKLPTTLKLIREVKTDSHCNTVCYHKGFTYIGQNGGAIDRVDQQGNIDEAFIKLRSHVVSLAAHEDALFCLMYNSNASEMSVYDISGKFLRTWNHPSFPPLWGSRMFVINNSQLVVGDWLGKQIIIYSFTGDVIRRVPCPAALMNNNVAMTSCGDGYAVISDRSAAIVVKISLEDGEVIWSVETDPEPCGIIHYNKHHLLVAHRSSTKAEISILDTQAGEFD